ncbi:MAG: fibrobacter succinogenes major paralogous domain-containing protein [Lentimicrobium sp.]|nr:fibrobacter succinogenes major paralogous domain-containing protein [Lentimicrobium sp.]
MQTRILLSVLMIGMIMGTFAQKPTMTLTFTADNNGQHVPLNSILIENLTQGGDTTLFSPDTILVINYVLGIGENETIGANVFTVFQNYPNPMEGQTTVNLYLPERENVLIIISDIVGRDIFKQEYMLDQGKHSFTFLPGKENLYFLTAWLKHQNQTIKMFNSPSNAHGFGICKLEYNGRQSGIEDYKSGNNTNNFVFDMGDLLRFTASSVLGERTIINTPSGDQNYTFQYGSGGQPCPGMPTITDIEGNVYNTVLIGEQCWMKENLKTTKYRNNTPIEYPGTDNDAWQNNTTGAYAWYNSDIGWKDSYGALYNWHAVNNATGLCPTGWHVPSDAEWTQLVDYVVAQGFPNQWDNPNGTGNALRSCRQVNSPLGGECNTSAHPRWEAHDTHHGFDEFSFSGFPGGVRYNVGSFATIGYYGYWWSSNEGSTDFAWFSSLNYDNSSVVKLGYGKAHGLSVRCLRDE